MAKISYRARKRMAPSKFVFPKGTKAQPGSKKFPIPDAKHARQALARAAQPRTKLTAKERCKVVKVVCKKFPSIGVCAGVTKSRRLAQCAK